MPRSRPYAVRPVLQPSPDRPSPPDPAELTANQAARRQRIVDTGLAVMLSTDYEDAQIRDVAEAAGVAVGTVYRYFPSKEHLFAAVFLAWQTELIDQIAEGRPRGSRRERLGAIVAQTVAAFERHPTFYTLMVMTSRTSDSHARQIARMSRDNSERVLAEPLQGLSPEDRSVVVTAIGAMLEATLGSWIAGGMTIGAVYSAMDRFLGLLRIGR